MTRAEWVRVARRQLGVDPDAMMPAPARSTFEGLTLEQLTRRVANNQARGTRGSFALMTPGRSRP